MKEELLKTTKNVLRKHRLPSDAIEVIYEHMAAAKGPLNEALGLNEGNLFRAVIPIEKNEELIRKEFPMTYSVVAHLLHSAVESGAKLDLSTMSLVKNEVLLKSQPGKISKIISKHLAEDETVVEHCKAELGISKPAQFMPKLGDVIKSGTKLVISTNVLDFLTSSNNAAFTSCHSFDGCHFNGNLAYIRDNITLIAYTVAENADVMQHELRKLGRCWVYAPIPSIVMPKSYGAFLDYEREATRKFLIGKFGSYFGTPNDYVTSYGVVYPGSKVHYEKPKDASGEGAALYLDNYGLEVSSPASEKGKIPDLKFSAAMCLMCADTTVRQKGGVCSEHTGAARGTCHKCQVRKDLGNLYTVRDELYCGDCVNKLFVQCNFCNQFHPKDTVSAIGGRRVCDACRPVHYVKCACCTKETRKRDMKDMGAAGLVCGDCVAKYILCSECNTFHHVDSVQYHKYVGRVCATCAPTISFECEGCGVHYHNKYKKEHDGKTICTTCHATATGKELPPTKKPKYVGLPAGWEDFTEEVG